jgi:hypothetical protein
MSWLLLYRLISSLSVEVTCFWRARLVFELSLPAVNVRHGPLAPAAIVAQLVSGIVDGQAGGRAEC